MSGRMGSQRNGEEKQKKQTQTVQADALQQESRGDFTLAPEAHDDGQPITANRWKFPPEPFDDLGRAYDKLYKWSLNGTISTNQANFMACE